MRGLTYKNIWKRLLDLTGAIFLVLLLSPILIITAILVRIKLGSPIIFTQDRLGLNGEVFTIWKFRSMTNCTDENGVFLADEYRLTKFGKLLRDCSLDELPQLWNVLIGDMSLIGPRPFIAEYGSRYTSEQMRRHEVRPGISGWAQIMGRNAISWNQKFILDVWYVDNCGFLTDLKILFRTIPIVLSRSGVSAENHVTMPEWANSELPSDDLSSK
ncbi:Lipid carrier : UDP-N-acetylgalactosaminyltransferase [hydrothermal vent metagenome]|uniref:Lipid carrier: UDP-N-acetylgalactosaminyltransferase n=1 Tax=hydrothermal vent metagenome TaxID=652676 RepID=A0A3B1BA82_9ZZZZ